MKTGDDDDCVAVDAIVETVREARGDKEAAYSTMHLGIGFRVLRDSFTRALQGIEKFVAQASALRLVPSIRVVDVRGSCRPDDDTRHRSRR